MVLALIGGIMISLSTSFPSLIRGKFKALNEIFHLSIFQNNLGWKISLFRIILLVLSIIFVFLILKTIYDLVKLLDEVNLLISGFFISVGLNLGKEIDNSNSNFPEINYFIFAILGIMGAVFFYFFSICNYIINFGNIDEKILTYFFFIFLVIAIITLIFYEVSMERNRVKNIDKISSIIIIIIFCLGILISDAIVKSKFLCFLSIKVPILIHKLDYRLEKKIDWRTLIAGFTFGIGWGLCNVLPELPVFHYMLIFLMWIIGLLIGHITAQQINYHNIDEGKENEDQKLILNSLFINI